MTAFAFPTRTEVLAPVLSCIREQGHQPCAPTGDNPSFSVYCRLCGQRVTGTITLDRDNEFVTEVILDCLTVDPCNERSIR